VQTQRTKVLRGDRSRPQQAIFIYGLTGQIAIRREIKSAWKNSFEIDDTLAYLPDCRPLAINDVPCMLEFHYLRAFASYSLIIESIIGEHLTENGSTKTTTVIGYNSLPFVTYKYTFQVRASCNVTHPSCEISILSAEFNQLARKTRATLASMHAPPFPVWFSRSSIVLSA